MMTDAPETLGLRAVMLDDGGRRVIIEVRVVDDAGIRTIDVPLSRAAVKALARELTEWLEWVT